ncbi:hypothetical protein BCR42DRAFT_405068 [Absidia repens]|uniref:Uncharacterized protein n=1 Tax=Absidia repens TaxID=90262 RepID=A0A1X2IX28_9FUNG|nr:hypothetical protein BCR42DRAFT_405068 [Absidia repens]
MCACVWEFFFFPKEKPVCHQKKLHFTVQYSIVRESYTRCIYLVTKRVFSILLFQQVGKPLKYVEESDINDEILYHSGYHIIKEKNYKAISRSLSILA